VLFPLVWSLLYGRVDFIVSKEENVRPRPVATLSSFRSIVVALLVLSCVGLANCSATSSAAGNPQDDYDAAVRDAQTTTAAKISKSLTAITVDNTALQWENGIPGSRVLVATYIDSQAACESYSNPAAAGCKENQECPAYGYNSWVTVAPELKNHLGNAPTLLRVVQALGLPPPATGKSLDNTCVLEFYISPANLFRPSPDPEVTDQEAELAFPLDGFRKYDDGALVYSEMPCDAAYCSICTGSGKCGMTSYRNWFDNRRAHVYTLPTPYPWTGLGYTYDWGNPVAPHIGVSEFVINAGSAGVPVYVKSVKWSRNYFSSN
jgi:hypothetical protein